MYLTCVEIPWKKMAGLNITLFYSEVFRNRERYINEGILIVKR